jgi:PiT family inorganic phosphate transporter
VDKIAPLLPILILGSIQSILTGISGAPSVIAAMIASRAIGVYKALILSTVAQFIGPFLFGAAAATVIGAEVVSTHGIPPIALYAGLLATIIWMLLAYYLRIPSSSTHAILGGLLGASIAASGADVIQPIGLLKVTLSLLLSAPIGMVGGFLTMRFIRWLVMGASPKINKVFNQGQWITSFGLGLALGSNNAQTTIGVITLGLVVAGFLPQFEVPWWVIAVCAAGSAIGNLGGGLRLIKSVGTKFFQIRPIHAFSAEIAALR